MVNRVEKRMQPYAIGLSALFLLSLAAAVVHAQPLPATGGDAVANTFLRDRWRSLNEQVEAYRPVFQAMGKDARIGRESRETLARIDAFLNRGRQLSRENRLEEALRHGDEAHRLAVASLVRLRAGETVTITLRFETPAEEYAYEERRFDSNEMLVGMMIEEGRATGEGRQRVDGFLAEGKRQRLAAGRQAEAGRHGEAVRDMESANAQLIRALQSMGVPVF